MTGPDVGELAPDFTLPDASGTHTRLQDLLGRPLVLYFYPADFTFFCTREACSFEDHTPAFEAAGARVVGVSSDPPGKHAAFQEKYGLSFTLLSDETGDVIEAYGASGLLGRTKRVTYVLDAGGVVVHRMWNVLPGPHVKQALAAIQEAV